MSSVLGEPCPLVGFLEGFTFHGDADRVFREFFGSDNPFTGNLQHTHTPHACTLDYQKLAMVEEDGVVYIYASPQEL